MTPDEIARKIGPEIRKHLFITRPIRASGPLVEAGLSFEANEIIAQAITEAVSEAKTGHMAEADRRYRQSITDIKKLTVAENDAKWERVLVAGVAVEREACAKIAEEKGWPDIRVKMPGSIAAAIRSRT